MGKRKDAGQAAVHDSEADDDIGDLLADGQQRHSPQKSKTGGNFNANAPSSTVFISNLAFDVTQERLEEVFSDIGPVKKCFVVLDRETKQSRGMGFVRYALKEDAETAIQKLNNTSLNGRTLKVEIARRKPGQDEDNEPEDKIHTPAPKPRAAAFDSDLRASIVISGLSPDTEKKHVYKRCRKIAPVKEVVCPLEGKPSRSALVRFEDTKSAMTAVTKLNLHIFRGVTISVVLASQEGRKKETRKRKARLILRNLSFKVKESDIEHFAAPFGKIVEIKIVKDAQNRSKGFGFVEFSTVESAGKALAAMNLKELKGRKIAVDWCVSREKYEAVKSQLPSASALDGDSGSESEEASESDNDSDGDESVAESGDSEKIKAEGADSDAEEASVEDAEAMDESSDEEVDEAEDSGSGSANSESSDDDEAGLEEGSEDKGATSKPQRAKPSDVEQGKTVFVRNIPFDAEEQDVGEEFEQFGPLAFAVIVRDKVTGNSRGTAFVKFENKTDADACLEAAEANTDAITVNGRTAVVSRAVDRSKAAELKTSNIKQNQPKEDKRNLYLAREGVIPTNTEVYDELSEADKKKRQRLELESNAKMKNPNFFVSKTRLSIHNLPKRIDDAELKKVFREYGGGRIAQCKVVRDPQRLDKDGKPMSRGFGFVEFANHQHALKALRELNNNPKFYSNDRRLIVQFAWDNVQIVKKRQEKLKRNQTRSEQLKRYVATLPGNDAGTPKPGKRKQTNEQKAVNKVNKGKAGLKTTPARENGTGTGSEQVAAAAAAGNNQKQSNPKAKVKAKQGQTKRKAGSDASHSTTTNRPGQQQQPQQRQKQQAASHTNGQQAKRHKPNTQTGSAKNVAKPAKGPSRKERKHSKEIAKEKKFDSLVQKYKQRLDGAADWAV